MIPTRKLTKPEYSFTAEEVTKANEQWGCNCGPAALAAILGVKLDVARVAIPGFEKKGYTNPTMMKEALATLGVKWRDRSANDPGNLVEEMAGDGTIENPWPYLAKPTDYRNFKPHAMVRYGLVRIQFDPWYGRLAYHFTHWVAAMLVPASLQEFAGLWVFDVNYGWRKFDDWASKMPELAKCGSPKSDGNWHATHRWEIEL